MRRAPGDLGRAELTLTDEDFVRDLHEMGRTLFRERGKEGALAEWLAARYARAPGDPE
jgi:hypothetical protein